MDERSCITQKVRFAASTYVPVKGKIAPTLFPTEYFVKQQEEDEE